MPYLYDLKIKKVSFVARGANRRPFFLAKSADSVDEPQKEVVEDTNNKEVAKATSHPSGGTTIVRPEIKSKLAEILKAERAVDKVVALLKEAKDLGVTEAEVQEISDILLLVPPTATVTVTDSAAEQRAAELAKALEAANAQNAELAKTLASEQDTRHRDEIKKWLGAECEYLNIGVDEAVETIIRLEKVDAAAAESMKKTFKGTSEALKKSALFKEVGRGGEGRAVDPIGGNFITELNTKMSEIAKSAGTKPSDVFKAALFAMGGDRYEGYRQEFNKRAKSA